MDLCGINSDELPSAFDRYDVFWFRLNFRISESLLRRSTRRVSVIVCPVTGLDHINMEVCRELGIRVISLKGETEFLQSVRATAELTIGLTLALLRKIPQASWDVHAGNWNRDSYRGRELLSKSVGIVGMGRLGRITSSYFTALGANVIAFDVQGFDVADVRKANSLEELIRESDIISIHVEYNEGTHHLFNEAAFKRCKRGAVLINTSRGAVVDSHALIRALEQHRLAGAALDVIEDEHRHEESKLIAYAKTHDNLLITPHIGGNTEESFAKTEVFVAQKLVEYAASVSA